MRDAWTGYNQAPRIFRWVLVSLALIIARPAECRAVHSLSPQRPSAVLSGHTDAIHAIAFFADGKKVASASHDGTVKLWDVETGACLHTFAGHEKAVRAVAVSPDGKRIASASDDRTARVWEVASGNQIAQLVGHAGSVRGVAFLPDGTLLTAGYDGTLRTWNVETEAPIWVSLHEDHATVMALSADGKRAVYGGAVGVAYVWDLIGKRRLGQYGDACGCTVLNVALNPDGSRVYTSVRDRVRRPFVVSTGAEVPQPAAVLAGEFGLSSDAKRQAGQIREVVDPDTSEQLHALELVMGGNVTRYAFSADHNVLAVGYGGDDSANGWQPSRINLIELFRLPDPSAPLVTGAPAGRLSWEVIPATVRELSTRNVVRLENKSWSTQFGMAGPWAWKTRSAEADPALHEPAVDVLLSAGVVLMHRGKGLLEEVLNDRSATYSDLTWDGRKFWIASTHGGVSAFDGSGKIIARVGAPHGLPAATKSMCVHALAVDRILVAGTSEPTEAGGWCAILEPDPAATQPASGGGRSYRVNVFLREADIHNGWGAPFEGRSLTNESIFAPRYITEPPTSADRPRREAWVVCGSVPSSVQPILKIDAETLKYTAYNLYDHPRQRGTPPSPHRPAAIDWEVAPAWLAADAVIARGAYNDYFTLRPGATMLDESDRSFFCDIGTYELTTPVPFAGKIYLPGRTWFELDATTRHITRLGPGVRSAAGELFQREGVTYFASTALNSLVAFAPQEGFLYRVSTDPKYPLPVRATVDPVLPSASIAKEGRVTFGSGQTTFECGGGLLSLGVNGLVSRRGAGRAVEESERKVGFSHLEASRLKSRLMLNESERKRIGLSPSQIEQLKHALPAFSKLDALRIQQLLHAFEQAGTAEARKAAARPILDEASAAGERWGKESDTNLTAFRALFNDLQWSQLRYDDPLTEPRSPSAAP